MIHVTQCLTVKNASVLYENAPIITLQAYRTQETRTTSDITVTYTLLQVIVGYASQAFLTLRIVLAVGNQLCLCDGDQGMQKNSHGSLVDLDNTEHDPTSSSSIQNPEKYQIISHSNRYCFPRLFSSTYEMTILSSSQKLITSSK